MCALAISPDGNFACTLSVEEDAFRVWGKNTTSNSTHWKCMYKVKTPSGYANMLAKTVSTASPNRQLITFSSDGTVLSVAYGPHLTLWDHANATLLTSVTLDDTTESVQSVDFLTKNDDALLLTTAGQIGVKSPFGGVKSCYLGNDEWSFNVGSTGKKASITAALPLHEFKTGGGGNGGFFAVAIKSGSSPMSVVSIIGRDEGSIVHADGAVGPLLQWQVDGEVQSLCLEKCSGSSIQLLAITKDCQMLSLSYGMDGSTRKGTAQSISAEPTTAAGNRAQVLKVGTVASADAQTPVKRRKISIGISRGAERDGGDLSGFDFPALSGKFTSSYIARSLGKR